MLRDHPDVSLLRKKLCFDRGCSGAFEINRQIIAELHYLCLKGGHIKVFRVLLCISGK